MKVALSRVCKVPKVLPRLTLDLKKEYKEIVCIAQCMIYPKRCFSRDLARRYLQRHSSVSEQTDSVLVDLGSEPDHQPPLEG